MASGQGSHRLTGSPTIVLPLVTSPSDIFVNCSSTLLLNIFTLPALSQPVNNVFIYQLTGESL